jgi:hypothetical protein
MIEDLDEIDLDAADGPGSTYPTVVGGLPTAEELKAYQEEHKPVCNRWIGHQLGIA